MDFLQQIFAASRIKTTIFFKFFSESHSFSSLFISPSFFWLFFYPYYLFTLFYLIGSIFILWPSKLHLLIWLDFASTSLFASSPSACSCFGLSLSGGCIVDVWIYSIVNFCAYLMSFLASTLYFCSFMGADLSGRLLLRIPSQQGPWRKVRCLSLFSKRALVLPEEGFLWGGGGH